MISAVKGSDIVQRILDILKFLWVLFLSMVDGFTMWLNMLTKQYVETSMVLCEERYPFIHNISQVSLFSDTLEHLQNNIRTLVVTFVPYTETLQRDDGGPAVTGQREPDIRNRP